MKNLLKKWIFIAKFHFQGPDPDPAWQFESGSTRIRIRNTGLIGTVVHLDRLSGGTEVGYD